jgi:hypothetical protein
MNTRTVPVTCGDRQHARSVSPPTKDNSMTTSSKPSKEGRSSLAIASLQKTSSELLGVEAISESMQDLPKWQETPIYDLSLA